MLAAPPAPLGLDGTGEGGCGLLCGAARRHADLTQRRVRSAPPPKPYPVTQEEVASLFKQATPPYPSAELCATIAKVLSEAMPAHWQQRPGFEAFADYNAVDPQQLAAIQVMRRSIVKRRKAGPQPWFKPDWGAVLDDLDHAIERAAPILAGPNVEQPSETHWHHIGWHVAELARLALTDAGHPRATVSRKSRAGLFTVRALERIGITVTGVAVEKLHASIYRRMAENNHKTG